MEKNAIERKTQQFSDSEPLILNEYLLVEDRETQEKFIVLNFRNAFGETLSGIEFEIKQFDREGRLLRKSEFVYDDFAAAKNRSFIPKSKIKADPDCDSIELRLKHARYETLEWQDGEWISDTTGRRLISRKLGRGGLHFPFHISLLIVLIIGALLSGSFALHAYGSKNRPELRYEELFDGTMAITKYVGSAKTIIIPEEIDGKPVSQIAPSAFASKTISSVYIRATNITISDRAFENCKRLETVIGKGIDYIGANAFRNCIKLTEVQFNQIGEIGEMAFRGCISLETFEHNSSMHVRSSAFADCEELKVVYLPEAHLNERVFEGALKLEELTFKDTDVPIFAKLFGNSTQNVPETLRYVSIGSEVGSWFYQGLPQIETLIIQNIKIR